MAEQRPIIESPSRRAGLPRKSARKFDDPGYVRLEDSERKHYCYAGVGTEPEWLVPTKAFRIEDLVGHYLLVINPVTGCIQRDRDRLVLSEDRVSAVVDPVDEIRVYGSLAAVAHANGVVKVKFGKKEYETAKNVPCGSLEGIRTPESRGSDASDSSCGGMGIRVMKISIPSGDSSDEEETEEEGAGETDSDWVVIEK